MMPPTTVQPWLRLRCPDCGAALSADAGAWRCAGCGRGFEFRDGIHYLLPRELHNGLVKEREKAGWARLCEGESADLFAHYLELPFSDDDAPEQTHYREAARQWRLAARYLEPLKGRRGLDLGGSIGWAAWRFAQAGAEMVLADFNDDARGGLGAASVYQQAGPAFDRLCVDAENLPLADGQFDFVFCCAFLHHMTRPGIVVAHAARTLRPGGVLIAAMEAFCPFWLSHQAALRRSSTALHFISEGVNEQVFRMSEYRRWFQQTGLRMEVLNPRWDDVEPGRIVPGRRLAEPGYRPEVLANRVGRRGAQGAAARLIDASGAWRPAAHPAIFPLVRPLLLDGTQKLRILIGTRPADGAAA